MADRPDSSIILDAWGNPYARPAPETLGERIAQRVSDRASLGSILTSITPARIRGIFAEADNGMIGRQIELARDTVERDGHLRSVLQLASLAVSGLDWIVVPGDESAGSQAAADWAKEWWDALGGQALIGRLMDAVHQQYAVEQVIWKTGDGEWKPIGSEQVDARRLCWPQTDGSEQRLATGEQGRAQSGQPVSVITPGLQRMFGNVGDIEAIMPGKYLCHMVDVERARPGHGAMCRATAVLWMLKHYAIIDWAGLVEKFGMPWTIVKYVPGMSDIELIALIDKLAGSRAERLLAVPNTAAVETTQGTSHTSSPPQEKMIAYIEETFSKVVLGNTTQTDAAANNDSVSSPTHQRGTTLLRDARAGAVAATLNRDLFAPAFEWNRQRFGAEAKPPRLEPVLGEKPDPKTRGEVYTTAAGLGLKVHSDQLYRELGIEKPEGVEEVLELKAQAPPSPFGGGFGGPGAAGFSPRGRMDGQKPPAAEEEEGQTRRRGDVQEEDAEEET